LIRWLVVVGLLGCRDDSKPELSTSTEPCAGDVTSTGDSTPSLEDFEATVTDYMIEYAIPNANVALMTASDDLILNLSFTNPCGGEVPTDGSAIPTPEVTTPLARYRIASISKLITATTAHMLEDAGTLSLDDRIIDHIDLEPAADLDGDGAIDTRDSRVADITLMHGLRHRSGWNCREEDEPHHIGDPSKADFRIVETYASAGTSIPLPIEIDHMLGYTAAAPLAWDPGTSKSYCSVGYVIMGEVIAAATGQPYADAVADRLLASAGMTQTARGHTLESARLTDEVRYHDHSPMLDDSVIAEGERAARPYGGAFNLENRFATGGWVSTAADLARFGRAFMRGDLVPDPDAIMAAEEGWPDHFAERERATGHTGSLEGSHALLMCFGPDDPNPVIASACWSFTFNKSPPRDITDPETGEEVEPRHVLAYELANDVLGMRTSL